jgi:hypothetical protein
VCVCDSLSTGIVGSNPAEGIDVCCECFVLSGRGLCVSLNSLSVQSYGMWCVVMCDLEASRGGHGPGGAAEQKGGDIDFNCNFGVTYS